MSCRGGLRYCLLQTTPQISINFQYNIITWLEFKAKLVSRGVKKIGPYMHKRIGNIGRGIIEHNSFLILKHIIIQQRYKMDFLSIRFLFTQLSLFLYVSFFIHI